MSTLYFVCITYLYLKIEILYILVVQKCSVNKNKTSLCVRDWPTYFSIFLYQALREIGKHRRPTRIALKF